MDLAIDEHRIDDIADVVDADVIAQSDFASFGVDLHRRQVGSMREVEVLRVEGCIGVQTGFEPVRQIMRAEGGKRDLTQRHTLIGALDAEPAGGEFDIVPVGFQQVRRDRFRLLDYLVRGGDDRHSADNQRTGAIGVHSLLCHLSVAVQDLDVVKRNAEPVGDDLAERGFVALAMRTDPGHNLNVSGRQDPHLRVLPATSAVIERPEHARWGETAHFGVGRDTDTELDPVAGFAPSLLLRAEFVVAEQLQSLIGGGLVVARIVLEPGDRRERELLVLDPVLAAQFDGIHLQFGGEVIHQTFDRERRLRTTRTAVGAGPRLVGEQIVALESVGREFVDRVVHERTEDRHAGRDDSEVCTHVGEQVHTEAGHYAVLGGRQHKPLHLGATVVSDHERFTPGLGELARFAGVAGRKQCDDLFRRHRQLAAEATTDIGCDDAHFRLGDGERQCDHQAQDVRHLGRRPHCDLLAGRVDHGRARLHERRDESLLIVGALDHDIAARPGVLDVAAGAGRRRVEHPLSRQIGAKIGMGKGTVRHRILEVEDDRELFIIHIDKFDGIPCLGRGAGNHTRHDLTGKSGPIESNRQIRWRLLVGCYGPGTRDAALLVGDVLASEHHNDAGRLLRLFDIDRRDFRVGKRAAHHGEVQHAGQHHVVGITGASGDEPLIFLTGPRGADLGDGHATPPTCTEASAFAFAAVLTALTMFWYPVQRQRLPSRPSRIACSSGSGCSRSRSIDAMIIPGVQNPHCNAWDSWKAACMG